METTAPQNNKPKCSVYIDGYNWYHAVFKHYPAWKWFNLQSFFEALRPHDNVSSIKLFSAWMDHDSDARERQERYFKALSTLPKVSLVLGVFQPREVSCRACNKKYMFQEEKKTDVNLAVHMISDAIGGACDSMFVVSGDSDIQPAVEWIATNRPNIKITIYVPALPQEQATRRTDYYKTKGLSVDCKFLPLGGIKDHQMKPVVKLPNGQLVARPHLWQAEPVVLAPV